VTLPSPIPDPESTGPTERLPRALVLACRRHGVRFTRDLLWVRVRSQQMDWLLLGQGGSSPAPAPSETTRGLVRRRYRVSTSRFGLGQVRDTNRTPLGLHRIAAKAGQGWPIGVVLENRRPVGFTWQGRPDAAIAHRVLWIEGLEPGFNRGGIVDTLSRTIYLHGVGNELTLGRPASRGCVHMAASDLIPLGDRLPLGTLVWIAWD